MAWPESLAWSLGLYERIAENTKVIPSFGALHSHLLGLRRHGTAGNAGA